MSTEDIFSASPLLLPGKCENMGPGLSKIDVATSWHRMIRKTAGWVLALPFAEEYFFSLEMKYRLIPGKIPIGEIAIAKKCMAFKAHS